MNNYSKLTLVEVSDFDVASSGITRTLINFELMNTFLYNEKTNVMYSEFKYITLMFQNWRHIYLRSSEYRFIVCGVIISWMDFGRKQEMLQINLVK
ncbi:hypothetical protein CN450_24655 [Bacillus cereus]|nr:hypothetical protein CN450_24655 [Bacillus cereus]